jgi:hypothetical protein
LLIFWVIPRDKPHWLFLFLSFFGDFLGDFFHGIGQSMFIQQKGNLICYFSFFGLNDVLKRWF